LTGVGDGIVTDKDQIYAALNRAYFSAEMHEKEVIENLPILLRGTRLFVDIGASLGQYTFFASQHMQGGRIVAIEPDPLRFEQLQRNCQEWSSASGNVVTALHGAVSDKDGQITFYATNSSVSGGLFKRELGHSVSAKSGVEDIEWHETEVQCHTLDTLFPNQSPDLIKIDVEGAELRVLRGASKILREGKTVFLVELHGSWADPEGQDTAKEVVRFMQSFGYHRLNFHGRTLFVNRRSRVPRAYRIWPMLGAMASRLRSLVWNASTGANSRYSP
jgi:FkbM family methyltransferase